MATLAELNSGKGALKEYSKTVTGTIERTAAVLANLKNFPVSPRRYAVIDIRSLHNSILENNPTFSQLKDEIEKFNNSIRRCSAINVDIPNYEWKHTLCIGLRNLLTEIFTTNDKELQEKFLNKVNRWYFTQIERKEGPLENKKPILPKEIVGKTVDEAVLSNKDSVKANHFLIATNPDLLLPSEYRDVTLKDYYEGARTRHDILEPPYERLQQYDRKFPNQILKPSLRDSRQKVSSQKKAIELRASPHKIQPQPENTMDASNINNTTSNNNNNDTKGNDDGEEGGDDDEEKPNKEEKLFKINIPVRKLYTDDIQTRYLSKTTDQMIPIEYRSNYAYYAPSGELPELSLEHRWRDGQNKKLMEKREHEELMNIMKEWSFAKSRIEEESVRRNESMTYGSKFESRSFKPRNNSVIVNNNLNDFLSPLNNKKNSTGIANQKPILISGLKNQTEENEEVTKAIERALDYDSDEEEYQEEPTNTSNIDPKSVIWEDKNLKTSSLILPKIVDLSMTSAVGMTTGEILPNKPNRPLEKEITKLKIEKIRKMNAQILNNSMRSNLNQSGYGGLSSTDASIIYDKNTARIRSLSVYDEKNNLQTPYKPFSAVFNKINDVTIRNERFDEIMEMKKKLAKFRLNVPTKVLATALLPTERMDENQLKPLPLPGIRLLNNPFIKEKKGKKKKKKT